MAVDCGINLSSDPAEVNGRYISLAEVVSKLAEPLRSWRLTAN
jgi:hypothetical protein